MPNGCPLYGILMPPRRHWTVPNLRWNADEQRHYAHERFLAIGLDLQLLRQIFKILGAAGVSPTIRIKQARSNRFWAYKDLGPRSARDVAFTVQSILNASAKSGAPLTKLDLLAHSDEYLREDQFDFLQASLQSIWSHLSSLALNLGRAELSVSSSGRKTLEGLLGSTRRLRILHLRIHERGGRSQTWSIVVESLATRYLTSLRLEKVNGTQETLKRFLERQRDSLQSLHMARITLPGEGDWSSILLDLAMFHHLTSITLAYMTGGKWTLTLSRRMLMILSEDSEPWDWCKLELRGREAIRNRMFDLAQTAKWNPETEHLKELSVVVTQTSDSSSSSEEQSVPDSEHSEVEEASSACGMPSLAGCCTLV